MFLYCTVSTLNPIAVNEQKREGKRSVSTEVEAMKLSWQARERGLTRYCGYHFTNLRAQGEKEGVVSLRKSSQGGGKWVGRERGRGRVELRWVSSRSKSSSSKDTFEKIYTSSHSYVLPPGLQSMRERPRSLLPSSFSSRKSTGSSPSPPFLPPLVFLLARKTDL